MRWGSWRPLLPIAALEALNEVVDILRYFVSRWPWSPINTINDILITLVPVALVVLAVRRPRRATAQMPQ